MSWIELTDDEWVSFADANDGPVPKIKAITNSLRYMDKTDALYYLDTVSFANLASNQFVTKKNILDNRIVGIDARYGRIYNFPAINDSRLIGAVNWSVPTDADWEYISNYYGGHDVAGNALKESGTAHWKTPNTGATNSSGFSGFGGGRRSVNGLFGKWDTQGNFWSSSLSDIYGPYPLEWKNYYSLDYSDSKFGGSLDDVKQGKSVRLIKSTTTLTNGQKSTYTGNDGTVYDTICIGTKEIMSVNLRETKYRNGNLIPFAGVNGINYTDTEWSMLTTSGCCVYGNSPLGQTTGTRNSYFSVNVINVSLPYTSSYVTLQVTSDYDFFYTLDSNPILKSWTAQSHDNSTLTITSDVTPSNTPVIAYVTVLARVNDIYLPVATIQVTKAANPNPQNTSINVNPNSLAFNGYGGEAIIQVTSNYDQFTVSVVGAGFYASLSNNSGNAELLISVMENPRETTRTAVAQILHGYTVIATINISQEGMAM